MLYQMRERLEPLALAESMPRLPPPTSLALDDLQERIEGGDRRVGDSSTSTGSSTCSPTPRCDIEPLVVDGRHGCGTPPSTTAAATCDLSGPERRWVVNAEHRLLLEAIERRDTGVAGLCLEGHIRRTRVELGRHPEVFSGPS